MKDAAEYLAYVKALIVVNAQVVRWVVVREEAQGEMGLLRYRLTLRGSGLLEMFELFQVVSGRVQVTKYSFHLRTTIGEDLCTFLVSMPTTAIPQRPLLPTVN